MSRFVRPETTRLDLTEGDYLVVKTRLNAGETREMYARMYVHGDDGRLRPNPRQTGLAKILAYLVDWSLTDLEGKPAVIRGRPEDEVTACLNNIDPDSFGEILAAVEDHEQATATARAQEKKRRDGGRGDEVTSPSPSAVTGALSGSAT